MTANPFTLLAGCRSGQANGFSRRVHARVLSKRRVASGRNVFPYSPFAISPFRHFAIRDLPVSPFATTKEKRKRNADRRVQPTSASRDAARTSGCARLSAFHHGSYRQAFGPWAQLQAWLPGTRQDVRSCTVAPTGERRPRVLTRALPAPACPSPLGIPSRQASSIERDSLSLYRKKGPMSMKKRR